MTDIYSDIDFSSNRDCIVSIINDSTRQEQSISSKKRKQKSRSSSSSSSIQSSQSTSRRYRPRNTTVLQSPRMLPFPYHNDSLFLPTVEQHRQSEKARSLASIRSGSIVSSCVPSLLPPSPTTSSSPKRRKMSRDQFHHHYQTFTPLLPSTSKYQSSSASPCSSHSWIQKAWKVLTRSSWRRQLSFSTKAMVAFAS